MVPADAFSFHPNTLYPILYSQAPAFWRPVQKLDLIHAFQIEKVFPFGSVVLFMCDKEKGRQNL